MRVMMVTGVRNEGQPGALERQRGESGAGLTLSPSQPCQTGRQLTDTGLYLLGLKDFKHITTENIWLTLPVLF